MSELLHADITERILGAAFAIHTALGPGFLEAIYDLIVGEKIVVELKAISELTDIHRAIVLSYLAATKLSVALLINFGQSSLSFKRIVRHRRST